MITSGQNNEPGGYLDDWTELLDPGLAGLVLELTGVFWSPFPLLAFAPRGVLFCGAGEGLLGVEPFGVRVKKLNREVCISEILF